jgi:hypothetical protein
MAEAMLDKLIEAVKSLKDGSDSQSEANTNVNQTSTEHAIDPEEESSVYRDALRWFFFLNCEFRVRSTK